MSLKKDLKYFAKEKNGLYIINDCFSFNNFYRLLLINGYDHEQAMDFVISSCSLSALVWQERIHNRQYYKLSAVDAIDPRDAARKAIMIRDFLEAVSYWA